MCSIGIGMGLQVGRFMLVGTITPPEFVAASTLSAYSATTTATASMPAGVEPGDLLLAFLAHTPTDGGITPPAAFDALVDATAATGTVRRMACFERIADGSEGASYSWTLGSAATGHGVILAYRLQNEGSPIEDTAAIDNGSTASNAAPSVDSLGTKRRLLCAYVRSTGGTNTPPAALTQRHHGNSGVRLFIGDVLVDAGATTQHVYNNGASTGCAAMSILIAPV